MNGPGDRPILIMAGGTGGHVFPALATAAVLKREGYRVEWLGTRRGIESELVPDAGIPIHFIAVGGLRGKGKLSLLLAPFKLMYALLQALVIVLRRRPLCVLGMGGFASGPGGLAAWLLRKPLLIHEQNAIPGLTNRLLSKLAGRVMEAFPGTFSPSVKALHTGNPIRESISAVSAPELRFKGREGALRLLVVGGSLGAQSFNELLPIALSALPETERPEVWHQAGKRHHDKALACYREHRVGARVDAFIADMNEAYAWADLVICRSGALTVSELSAVGVASILVPFPYAVDDHQSANAAFLADHQAAILVQQRDLDAVRLAALLVELNHRDRLLEMAKAARAQAKLDASQLVAQNCQEAACG